jgi:diacylglycerol kinase (ATP)
MDKEKLCIIFNPAAKGEKAGFLHSKLKTITAGATIVTTERVGQAEPLAAQAVEKGFTTIVAAGGDGTVNAVINGIADSEATLGILPIGTMNVFGYEIGLPINQIRQCWEIIQGGNTRCLDLGLANDQYFVQLAGVGLDAQAVADTDLELRRKVGPLSYILAAAEVITRPPPVLTVAADGSPSVEGCFVLIGNGRHYGGPLSLFKAAENNDGLLDVIVFRRQGYLDVLRYLQGILFGNYSELADVEYLQTRRLTVHGQTSTPVEIDGEVLMRTPVEFRIAPAKLHVLAP